MSVDASFAQERPFILADKAKRDEVLGLIETYDWAAAALARSRESLAEAVAAHKASPAEAMKNAPSLATADARAHGNWMAPAMGAAQIYFLTGDGDYAQFAADRLNRYVQHLGVAGKEPSVGKGGEEARYFYHTVGLAYDFVHPFLKRAETKVYDAATGQRAAFAFAKAQTMFTNILDARLPEALDASNIGIMQFDGILYCALCVEDQTKRDDYIRRLVLGQGGKKGLSGVKALLMGNNGVLPEAGHYSGVGEAVPYLMEVVDRLYPSYRIFEGYENALLGVANRWYFTYPNGTEAMAHGDSRRRYAPTSGDGYIRAIRRAGFEGVAEKLFGKIKADRAIRGYQPDNLWTMDPLEDYEAAPLESQAIHLPRNGLVMQRNEHTTDPFRAGLMYYTGGANYVHSQLSGLDLELYGAGQVMSGVGSAGDEYRGPGSMPPDGSNPSNRNTFRFVSYYRNYAGHNTVVINGESKGAEKGWKSQYSSWMDTVKLQAMEPMPYTPAVAKEFAFSCQQLDDTVNKATQQRTVAMVRTSDVSGYYLDVFRSRASGENRFHDYLYHNIGDSLALQTAAGGGVALTPDVRVGKTSGGFSYLDWQRYASKVIREASGGGSAPLLSPGWHYFDNVAFSAGTTAAIVGRIDLTVNNQPRQMHVLMPGGTKREYTTATAPGIAESMKPYDQRPARVLSIRQPGEAWDKPFVVAFEPATSGQRTVQKVENLMDGAKVVGAKVVSEVGDRLITDWILALDDEEGTYTNVGAKLSFKGRFGIAREVKRGTQAEIFLYLGDGSELAFQGQSLSGGATKKGYRSGSVTIEKVADGAEAGLVKPVFRVKLPVAVNSKSTIHYSVEGSATAGADFSALKGSIDIPAGRVSSDIPVAVLQDAIVEGMETIALTLTSVGGGASGASLSVDPTATANLMDDDSATVNITAIQDAFEKGAPQGSFRFTQSKKSSRDSVITYGVSGTAKGGTDYMALGGTVTLPAGQTSVDLPVVAIQDDLVEGDESLILTLSGIAGNPGVALGDGGVADLNLIDDDAATVTISRVSDGSEAKLAKPVFRIVQSAKAVVPSVITYSLSGTASAGADYTTPVTNVTIPAGQTSVDLPVTVVQDALVEGTETITLTLTGVTSSVGVSLAPVKTATASLTDNDTATVTITKLTEGSEEGLVKPVFRVTQSAVSAANSVVTYSLSGTASAGTDYTAPGTNVMIPAGQTSVDLPVTVVQDALVEGTETITLTLTGVTSSVGVSLAPVKTVTASLTDNDTATVTITKITEGSEEGLVRPVFRITQSAAGAVNSVVTYTISGTASAGADYSTPGTSVTIPAGQTSVDLPVTILQDAIVEDIETITLTLTGVTGSSGVSLGATRAATSNLTDNDTATIAVTKLTDGSEEGLIKPVFRITQSAVASSASVVTCTISGTASAGTDYTTPGANVMIAAGQTSVDLPVTILQDALVEGTETITLTLTSVSGSSGVSLGTSKLATANLSDDDTATVTIAKITEGSEEGLVRPVFRVTQSAVSAANSVVTFNLSGTASAGTDYTTPGTSVTIPAGQTSIDLPVTVLQDSLVEGSETITLTLTGVTGSSGVSLGATRAATSNLSDDDTATVTIAKLTDGSEEGLVRPVFRVTQSAVSAVNSVVTYSLSGTASAGTDYTAPGANVMIAAGQTSVDLPLTVVQDTLVEGTETITLTLTGVTGSSGVTLGTSRVATASLTDNDTATIAVTKLTDGSEEGLVKPVFRITQSAAGAINTAVTFSLSGTASAGTDYTTPGTSVMIAAGQTSVDLPVTVLQDSLVEGSETITLTLTGVTGSFGVSLGTSKVATANLADDDSVGITITTTDDDAAEQPVETGTWRISRNDAGGELVVILELEADGTASSTDWTQKGASFLSTDPGGRGSVTIPAGKRFVDVVLTPVADPLAEDDERVILKAVAGSGYRVSNTPAPGRTITIRRNGFVVTTVAGRGQGSLRQAVENANQLGGAPAITFAGSVFTDAAPDVIDLGGSEIEIAAPMTLVGPGADRLTLTGRDASRLIRVTAPEGEVAVHGFTLTRGWARGQDLSGAGGAILKTGASKLSIRSCHLVANTAESSGGAIHLEEGGGAIHDSTLSGNAALGQWEGGGALCNRGDLTLVNSTLSGNRADRVGSGGGGGGAILNRGHLSLQHATIVLNRSSLASGGGGLLAAGRQTLSHSLIAGNTLGGDSNPSDIEGPSSCEATYLIVGDAATAGRIRDGVQGNKVGLGGTGRREITTLLDPALGNNGGPTPTHRLVPGSPAIDAGAAPGSPGLVVPPLDQRGQPRVAKGRYDSVSPRIDLGAYELFAAPRPGPGALASLMIPAGGGILELAAATGFTPGGTFAGTGVVGGRFRAAGLAAGTYELTYTVKDAFGAVNTTHFTVMVSRGAVLEAPESLNFRSTVLGRTGSVQRAGLRNRGDLAVHRIRVVGRGAARRDFRIQQAAVDTLAPGGATTVRVSFRPGSNGLRRAYALVLSDTLPERIRLRGIGTGE